MKVPQELKKLIINEIAEIKSSISGELILPKRRLIWSQIVASSKDRSIAHRLLTELDVQCVKYTMHKWEQVFPCDNSLDQMISLAKQVLDNLVDIDTAEKQRDAFYVDVVECRNYQPHEYPAMFVGHAAANIVTTAISDFEEGQDYFLQHDDDLDPECFESSYLAACAYSGGLLGKGDTEKRRDFWLWYLQSAIKKVYSDI